MTARSTPVSSALICLILLFLAACSTAPERSDQEGKLPLVASEPPSIPWGFQGLWVALSEGLIRKATEEDFENWYEAVSDRIRRFTPPVVGTEFPRKSWNRTRDKYVVLKPFTYQPGLFGNGSAILVPKGIPWPRQDWGNSTVYYYDGLYCDGIHCPEETRWQSDPTVDPRCVFPELDRREDFSIFAVGAYKGEQLSFQIDKSGHAATRIDVVVNSTEKPVVLMLGAYEPTVWTLNWTHGTRIVGIFLSGYHRQAADPGDRIPTLISTFGNKSPCGYFYVSEGAQLLLVNPLSKRLFGREADMVFKGTDGRVVVGDPLTGKEELLPPAQIDPRSFAIGGSPAGQAGLDAAIESGVIRRASQDDLHAWELRIAEARSLPGPPKPSAPNWRPAYVVLKEFTFPEGLYGAHSADFLVPRGVPKPQGNPGHSAVYYFEDLSCTACD